MISSTTSINLSIFSSVLDVEVPPFFFILYGAIFLFILWLNFSPTPTPNTQNIRTEEIVSLRGGKNESSEKLGLFGRWNNFFKRSTTSQNPSRASSNTKGITDVKKDTSNVEAQKSDSLPGEKTRYLPGGSPSGNDNITIHQLI